MYTIVNKIHFFIMKKYLFLVLAVFFFLPGQAFAEQTFSSYSYTTIDDQPYIVINYTDDSGYTCQDFKDWAEANSPDPEDPIFGIQFFNNAEGSDVYWPLDHECIGDTSLRVQLPQHSLYLNPAQEFPYETYIQAQTEDVAWTLIFDITSGY